MEVYLLWIAFKAMIKGIPCINLADNDVKCALNSVLTFSGVMRKIVLPAPRSAWGIFALLLAHVTVWCAGASLVVAPGLID